LMRAFGLNLYRNINMQGTDKFFFTIRKHSLVGQREKKNKAMYKIKITSCSTQAIALIKIRSIHNATSCNVSIGKQFTWTTCMRRNTSKNKQM